MRVLPTDVVRGRKNPLHLLFPARLRHARKAQQLSASALSTAAGLSRGSVAFLEAGTRIPRVNSVEHLAYALSVAPDWLAFGLGSRHLQSRAADGLCRDLGGRVLQVKTALGLGNKDLGRRAELSPAEIRAVLTGTMPTIDRVERLASGLSVSPAWLAFGLGPMELPTRRGSVPGQKAPARQPYAQANSSSLGQSPMIPHSSR